MKVSVVIVTRNPREEYFTRALQAVSAQTLNAGDWEVVVVDSSEQPVSGRSLPFPANLRFVRELKPGVLRARMAGVQATVGEWILFVDDDNVLDADYLANGLEIMRQRPQLDIFCGRISGEFETPPEEWIRPYLANLAVVEFNQNTCSNERDFNKIPFWTAGMFIRRKVVVRYFEFFKSDPFRFNFLNRCDDVDMVLYSIAQGSYAGRETSLHMRHLISRDRLQAELYIETHLG